MVNKVVAVGGRLWTTLWSGRNCWLDGRFVPASTKQLMRAPLAAQVAAAMADESTTVRRLPAEPAAREAMTAFLQKRPPDLSKVDAQASGARG